MMAYDIILSTVTYGCCYSTGGGYHSFPPLAGWDNLLVFSSTKSASSDLLSLQKSFQHLIYFRHKERKDKLG